MLLILLAIIFSINLCFWSNYLILIWQHCYLLIITPINCIILIFLDLFLLFIKIWLYLGMNRWFILGILYKGNSFCFRTNLFSILFIFIEFKINSLRLSSQYFTISSGWILVNLFTSKIYSFSMPLIAGLILDRTIRSKLLFWNYYPYCFSFIWSCSQLFLLQLFLLLCIFLFHLFQQPLVLLNLFFLNV